MDVSYLFDPQTKDVVKSKYGQGQSPDKSSGNNLTIPKGQAPLDGFTMRNRGESMRKLSQELKSSKDNKIRKHISVQEFYHFYLYFKELIPVMKHLSQKYAKSADYIGFDANKQFMDEVLLSSTMLDDEEYDMVDINKKNTGDNNQISESN